jgi:phasin family protein
MATDTNHAGGDTPFSQAINQAKSAAEDFTRLFSDLKIPAVPDVETLLSAHRRNMDTLSAANRIALEGAQAVAKRHMEIMQQTMSELSETLRSLASPGEAPQAKAAKQADLLKRTYERAVSNTRELSDLIQRSNGEALDLLNKRFTEAVDEVKSLVEKSGAPKF